MPRVKIFPIAPTTSATCLFLVLYIPAPTVNAPANATTVNALAEASSAEPQYGGQGEFMSPSIVYPLDLY